MARFYLEKCSLGRKLGQVCTTTLDIFTRKRKTFRHWKHQYFIIDVVRARVPASTSHTAHCRWHWVRDKLNTQLLFSSNFPCRDIQLDSALTNNQLFISLSKLSPWTTKGWIEHGSSLPLPTPYQTKKWRDLLQHKIILSTFTYMHTHIKHIHKFIHTYQTFQLRQ